MPFQGTPARAQRLALLARRVSPWALGTTCSTMRSCSRGSPTRHPTGEPRLGPASQMRPRPPSSKGQRPPEGRPETPTPHQMIPKRLDHRTRSRVGLTRCRCAAGESRWRFRAGDQPSTPAGRTRGARPRPDIALGAPGAGRPIRRIGPVKNHDVGNLRRSAYDLVRVIYPHYHSLAQESSSPEYHAVRARKRRI
jgi:hypothetical protein